MRVFFHPYYNYTCLRNIMHYHYIRLVILEANVSSLEYLYLLDHPVERGLVGNFHEGHYPSIATRNPIRVTYCPARGYHSQPSKGRTNNPARVFSRSPSIDYHSGGGAAPNGELHYSRPIRGHSHQLKKGECMSPRDITQTPDNTLQTQYVSST